MQSVQSASIDSNPSSPASIGRKEMATTTKGRRKQSYPSKAPASPDIIASYQYDHSNEEQAHDFTTWSSKIKNKVLSSYEKRPVVHHDPILSIIHNNRLAVLDGRSEI